MDYIDGKLIVDELIIDPSLPTHVVVRIGADFYMLRNHRSTPKVKDSDLQPYKKQPHAGWYRPMDAFQFWVHGLIPRGGYVVEAGRPATEDEFSEIVEQYGLTDDDISNVFTDTRGAIFGEAYQITFPARQIQVAPDKAIPLERALREKGIEASNGAPGRVNIRVDQPVKQ